MTGFSMKRALFFMLGLALNPDAASGAGISIGPTFSGGEIHKQYSYDMYGTTGIYELGLHASAEAKHVEASLHFETGWHNRNPCLGAGFDLNGKYGMLKDRVKLYGGFGFAYDGYAYGAYAGRNSFFGEHEHNLSPYLTVKAELFNVVRLGFEELSDPRLFWKARLSLALFRF